MGDSSVRNEQAYVGTLIVDEKHEHKSAEMDPTSVEDWAQLLRSPQVRDWRVGQCQIERAELLSRNGTQVLRLTFHCRQLAWEMRDRILLRDPVDGRPVYTAELFDVRQASQQETPVS